ncbi:MAG: hypothetical protein MI700_07075, partial [Balneolales bacterium]|nr:hypothetical protein [Balneolales bacterium]
IISDGKYVGDKDWKDLIAGTIGGTITQTCASIGGASDVIYDFRTIQKIYEANGNSFSGTNLERNFNVLKSAFPDISIIDLDNEDNTDKASMVAFCEMLIGIGFDITFCPFTSQEFWNSCLAFLHASESYRGKVKWWNLQCYSGGTGNNPDTWATSIANEIPGFDTNGFIIPGASTDGGASGVQDLMKTFRGEKSVGGGFIWTLGNIIDQYPLDPLTGMKAYVNAIKEGLTGTG